MGIRDIFLIMGKAGFISSILSTFIPPVEASVNPKL